MNATPKYSQEYIDTLLNGVFDGSITEYDIPESLYFSIADHLKNGLYRGFGGDLTKYEGKDLELLAELRENVYMFSAAKSYQELKDIRSLMFDENGDRVTQREFSRLGEQAFENWNQNWGRTEYNTAIAQGTMGSKWNEIQRNKDLLPNLSYQTIGDACDICAPLDGFTAPVDDPVWESIYPTNHFNCLCVVTQEDSETLLTPDDEKTATFEQVTKEMSPVFKMNAGIDRYVYSPEHPYFSVEKKDLEFSKNNFNLPIPKEDPKQ